MKTLLSLLLFVTAFTCLAQDEVSVRIAIESRDVLVGEAFVFQVVVSNAKDVKDFDFPATNAFVVQPLGPSNNNSTQISIVNGKYSKIEKRETLYNFRLVAKQEGNLVIPSLTVVADGKTFRTQPVRIHSSKGEEITDIVLELKCSDTECYVGQTVMAHWKLYFARNIQLSRIELPLLENSDFSFPPYETPIDKTKIDNYRRLPISDTDSVIAYLSYENYDGMQVRCLSFSRPITAQKAGEYSLSAGRVLCSVPDKRARRTRRSPFDFFDSEPMRSVMIDGKSCTLKVKELPEAGRPANFSGIIGACSIVTTAKPVDVNVGDPIVLTITLKGLPYPDTARLPALTAQPALAKSFRISDQDSGVVQDGNKVFQCTLRAQNSDVKEIPALSLAYFDSPTGTYSEAKSPPIPITVHAVKTVTAADAQGTVVAAPVAGTEVKALDDGIAHNVAYDKLLHDDRAGFFNWSVRKWQPWLCLGCLLLYWLCGLVNWMIARRNADPARLAAQHLLAESMAVIQNGKADVSDLFKALQGVLAAKLRLPPGTLTFRDVQVPLEKSRLKAEDRESLAKLFDAFEAASYSGGTADASSLQAETQRLAKLLSRTL